MKKYILFAGSNYYPSGGWEDFVSSDDDLDVLVNLINNSRNGYDWWHIVDTEINYIIKDNWG